MATKASAPPAGIIEASLARSATLAAELVKDLERGRAAAGEARAIAAELERARKDVLEARTRVRVLLDEIEEDAGRFRAALEVHMDGIIARVYAIEQGVAGASKKAADATAAAAAIVNAHGQAREIERWATATHDRLSRAAPKMDRIAVEIDVILEALDARKPQPSGMGRERPVAPPGASRRQDVSSLAPARRQPGAPPSARPGAQGEHHADDAEEMARRRRDFVQAGG